MPYCLNCGAKYKAGDSDCTSCNRPLPVHEISSKADVENTPHGVSNLFVLMRQAWTTLRYNLHLFLLPVVFSIIASVFTWVASINVMQGQAGFSNTLRLSSSTITYMINSVPDPVSVGFAILSVATSMFHSIPGFATGAYTSPMAPGFAMFPIVDFAIMAAVVYLNAFLWKRVDSSMSKQSVQSGEATAKYGLVGSIAIAVNALALPLVWYIAFSIGQGAFFVAMMIIAYFPTLLSPICMAIALTVLIASRFRIPAMRLFTRAALSIYLVQFLVVAVVMQALREVAFVYLSSTFAAQRMQFDPISWALQYTLNLMTHSLLALYLITVLIHYLRGVARDIVASEGHSY